MKTISISGAKEHNLKNIDLTIPKDQLVVFTGVSGSGKSSLAFDTIYAEGQRRYMESLSSYARQFLGNNQKPLVDKIEGLSPAIAIDQKTTNRNPRSTVGTVTEIYDYFRLLYARIGIPHCPKCGKPIRAQSIDQIVDAVLKMDDGTKFMILAPVVRGEKGKHQKLLSHYKRSGFVRVIIDGEMHDFSEDFDLNKNIKHHIDIVVDRLKKKDNMKKRLTDSVETALKLSDGLMKCQVIGGESTLYSEKLSCPDCGISMPTPEPRSFSFNNPFGMCPTCNGLGFYKKIDPDRLVPDR
ncbi:MAG: excinuclease ABC subunit UvrA, partial [Eubacteriaceae bacterium]|nr:excinuclease ABC subunit UvrA [Eubacteriaceae bacterium]